MKGLLIKDFINLRQQLKIYIIIIILWFFISLWNGQPGFFSGIMVMFAVMIPMTAVAYDDSCGWNVFAVTSPLSRKKIILSKYLIMLISIVVSAVIACAGSMVLGESLEESIFLSAVLFPFGIIMGAVLMPVIFKFGVEKGRFAFIAVVAAAIAVISFVGPKLPDLFGEGAFFNAVISMSRWSWLAFLTGFMAGLGCISFFLSVRIYGKKEF